MNNFLNESRNNRPTFLMDHNSLGLGKLSTTMKRLLLKTATYEKKAPWTTGRYI